MLLRLTTSSATNGKSLEGVHMTRLTCHSANLLYPREDRQLNKLLYVCKACNSSEENEPACTYRQDLSEGAQESMGEKAFVAHDPTVGDTEDDTSCFCTTCGQCLKCNTCGEPNSDESERSEDVDES